MGIGWESGTDFDQMVRDVDVKVAKAVEACVSDLAAREKAAVFHKFLRAAWHESPEIYAQSIDSALILIGIRLEKRGIL
jgi:hypothetical protein